MTNEATKEENITPVPQKQPLVFISHDTRDAEIAEAFSKLLGSVSAGVLKSFRSSDKKGTQGMEYGVEWFPEIMKKLNDASDIVCLLTTNSINRPWILYEAGVAKGKLNNTVFGVALGIQLNEANNGPFAQFQNCGDDEDSLTKLTLQLVKRIPNAEPDEDVIKQQVHAFKEKIGKILPINQQSTKKKETKLEEDASIAKLFEEVKVMFQDLPSRINQQISPKRYMREKQHMFHPMMFEELLHISRDSDDINTIFLIMISYFRNDIPWVYEIGLETYHTLCSVKGEVDRQRAVRKFMQSIKMLDHPMMREFIDDRSREAYMIYREYVHMFRNFCDRYYHGKIKE